MNLQTTHYRTLRGAGGTLMLLCSLAHNVGFEAEDVAGADLEAVGDPEGVEVDGKS